MCSCRPTSSTGFSQSFTAGTGGLGGGLAPIAEAPPDRIASWPISGLYFVPIKTRDYRRNSIKDNKPDKGTLINYSFRACMSNRVFWQQEQNQKSSITEDMLMNVH